MTNDLPTRLTVDIALVLLVQRTPGRVECGESGGEEGRGEERRGEERRGGERRGEGGVRVKTVRVREEEIEGEERGGRGRQHTRIHLHADMH